MPFLYILFFFLVSSLGLFIIIFLNNQNIQLKTQLEKSNMKLSSLKRDNNILRSLSNQLSIELKLLQKKVNTQSSNSAPKSTLNLSDKEMKLLRFHIHPDKTQGKTEEIYKKIFN